MLLVVALKVKSRVATIGSIASIESTGTRVVRRRLGSRNEERVSMGAKVFYMHALEKSEGGLGKALTI